MELRCLRLSGCDGGLAGLSCSPFLPTPPPALRCRSQERTRNSEKVLTDYHFESKLLFQNQYFPFISFYDNFINFQVS